MNFEQLQNCFQDRINHLEELAEKTNKKTVLVLQQFPTDSDAEILVPNVRESISNIIAFVELGDLKALEYVVQKADAIFDAIVVDIDLKCSFSRQFIEYSKNNIKQSLLFFYNDNAVWADSALNYIQNIENGLYGKNVLLCGEGFLFTQLLLRLLDYGTKVYTETNLDFIYTNINSKFKISKNCVHKFTTDADYKNIDFVIGGSTKKTSLHEKTVKKLSININLYDIGIGNFSKEVIEITESKSAKVYRLDNRAGISALLISLFETNYLINEMMGKVYIKNVEIVAGGLLGKNGAIIVDNVKNPSSIIGIADGKGKVKPNPENEIELRDLNFVKALIDKSK